MIFEAAGEEPDPSSFEFVKEIFKLLFTVGLTYKFEENGVFIEINQGEETRGTWSRSENMLTVTSESTDGVFYYVVDGNLFTLSVPIKQDLEQILSLSPDLTIEELLKDVPDFEIYFRRG